MMHGRVGWSGIAGVCIGVIAAGCGTSDPVPRPETTLDTGVSERVATLHASLLTIDTHDDIPLDFATPDVDPGQRGARQVDLPRMEEGGLDAGFFVVYVGQTERTPENYAQAQADALTKFEAIHRMAETLYPDRIEIAYTADDFERIVAAGKLVAAIGIENGFVVGKDLSLLETYHRLGARYLGLAHNGHNDIADSAAPRDDLGDVPVEHDGVSPFGEAVIAEMNRLGMMVDVSHVSKSAMLDAVRMSRAPIIASHSSTHALTPHPRNLDDEQLRALRDNGGVMQAVALGSFISRAAEARRDAVQLLRADIGLRRGDEPGSADLTTAQREEYDQGMAQIDRQWPAADVATFVDHIDYAVELIGIDHVGISSDFDGGGGISGWSDASETANVTAELVRRGYTDDEIAKVWGGNLLRVLRAVERVAASSRP